MALKIGMSQRVLGYYQVYSNDNPGFILTYFTAMSTLVPYAFVWEKGKTVDFSATVGVYDIKVGRRSQLNGSTLTRMNIKGHGHSLTLVPRSLRFNISKRLFLRNRLAD